MSEWNIYTVGSVDFIYNVFNAIAMMMNNGMYSDTFRVAALLGVIGIVISSAISGGKTLSFSQMAVCLVMYMIFFQISARVNLEDVKTGEFRAVDNVPWGLAAPASIISLIGYSITENMEQAFSTPAMTTYGALDPLFTLTAYYDAMKDPMRWALGTGGSAGDIAASIDSYIRTCVSNDIIRDANTYAHLWRNAGGSTSLRSSDSSTYVVLYDNMNSNGPLYNPRNASQYTCAEAYTKLSNQASVSSGTLLSSAQKVKNMYGRGSTETITQSMQDMLEFYGASSVDIREFQLLMLVLPNIQALPQTLYTDSFKTTAAITRAQSATQQAFQWSSSGSSFLYWMNSFMPIFQGIIYSLAPFMAFLVGLGLIGLRMLMKYFLIIIWTQTWIPLAAVVNLYMLTKMQSEASSILSITSLASGVSTIAFNQLYDLIITTQKNIGLAGNLFALIPALGSFIVWGSSIAFNSLANSAAAPAPADTKTLAPDITNAPAILNRTSDVAWSPTSGMQKTGASNIVGSLNVNETAATNLASAKANKEVSQAAQTAAQNTLVNSLASNMQNGQHSTAQNDIVAGAIMRNFGARGEEALGWARKHNMDSTDLLSLMNSQTLAAKASASGGVGRGPFNGNLSAEAGAASARSDQKGQQYGSGENGNKSKGSALTDMLGANYNTSLQNTVADLASQTSAFGISSSVGSSYTNAYSNLQSAEKQFTEAMTFTQSTGIQQSIGFDALGERVAQSPGLDRKMQQSINGIEGGAVKRNELMKLMQTNGMTERNAEAAASVKVLAGAGKLGEIAHDLGLMTNSTTPEVTPQAARQYQGVGVDAETVKTNMGNIQSQASGGAAANQSAAQGFYQQQAGASEPEAGRNAAFNLYDTGKSGVQVHYDEKSNAVRNEDNNSAYNSVASLPTHSSPTRYVMGLINSSTSRIAADNPVYEETYRQARQEVAKYAPNNEAADAIARYYALGKAGAGGQILGNARDQMITSLQSVNQREGGGSGNLAWAQKAATLIDQTFEDQRGGDLNTLGLVLRGAEASSGKELPNQHPTFNQGSSINDPRSSSRRKPEQSEDVMLVTPKTAGKPD